MNSPAARNAQATNNTNSANSVTSLKTRDEWMKEVCLAGGTMSPLQFRTAMRLALFFNCTTGQCNPGYPKLAKAVNAKIDSVKKVCRQLEAAGWIKRNGSAGGNHDDKTEFDLLMPDARVSVVDTPRVSVVNPRVDCDDRSKTGPDGCPKPALTGVHRGLANEQREQREQSAPPARSSAYVDRIPVTEIQDDDDDSDSEFFDPYANTPRPDEAWHEEVRLREQAQFREIIAQMNGSTTLQSSL